MINQQWSAEGFGQCVNSEKKETMLAVNLLHGLVRFAQLDQKRKQVNGKNRLAQLCLAQSFSVNAHFLGMAVKITNATNKLTHIRFGDAKKMQRNTVHCHCQ